MLSVRPAAVRGGRRVFYAQKAAPGFSRHVRALRRRPYAVVTWAKAVAKRGVAQAPARPATRFGPGSG